jgi:hypothetical protein
VNEQRRDQVEGQTPKRFRFHWQRLPLYGQVLYLGFCFSLIAMCVSALVVVLGHSVRRHDLVSSGFWCGSIAAAFALGGFTVVFFIEHFRIRSGLIAARHYSPFRAFMGWLIVAVLIFVIWYATIYNG